tara:strand:+ start:2077 stop:2370 length:294 start_codon:yes stop_codon:yes gene_type:complete
MKVLNIKTLNSIDKLNIHEQKMIKKIFSTIVDPENDKSDKNIKLFQNIVEKLDQFPEEVMPELEMLYNRLIEDPWEDDVPHFKKLVVDTLEDINNDY